MFAAVFCERDNFAGSEAATPAGDAPTTTAGIGAASVTPDEFVELLAGVADVAAEVVFFIADHAYGGASAAISHQPEGIDNPYPS
jgi:hypothetical protein